MYKIKNKNVIGIFCTLVGAVFWGFSGTNCEFLIKKYNVNPTWLSSHRMLIAGVIILTYLFIKDGKKVCTIFANRRDVITLLLFSIFGMIANQLAYLYTIANTNAGTATVIQYIAPVFIMIYVCITKNRVPTKKEIISIILVFIGIFFITTQGNPSNLVISRAGLFWGLMSAITLMVYNVLPVNIIAKFGALTVTGYAMLIGGSLEYVGSASWKGVPNFDGIGIAAFVFVILVGTIVSYTLYLTGVQMIGPLKAGMLAAIEPVSATIFTVVFLGTHFTYMDLLGFVIIIITIFILSKKEKSSKIQENSKLNLSDMCQKRKKSI